MNKDNNVKQQNLQDPAKTVLKGKCKVITACIKKLESHQIIHLKMNLKDLEKQEPNPKIL